MENNILKAFFKKAKKRKNEPSNLKKEREAIFEFLSKKFNNLAEKEVKLLTQEQEKIAYLKDLFKENGVKSYQLRKLGTDISEDNFKNCYENFLELSKSLNDLNEKNAGYLAYLLAIFPIESEKAESQE
jgi:hypothetical protein